MQNKTQPSRQLQRITTPVKIHNRAELEYQDVDVDGVCERRPKPLCPHLEITSR